MVGSLFIGIMAGTLAAGAAFVTGAGWVSVLAAYSLTGSLVLLGAAVLQYSLIKPASEVGSGGELRHENDMAQWLEDPESAGEQEGKLYRAAS